MRVADLMRWDRGPAPQSQAGYEALVRRIADGEQVEEAEVAEVLNGRPTDALTKDVERLQARRQAVQDLDDCKAEQLKCNQMMAEFRQARAAIAELPISKMLAELREAEARVQSLNESARDMQGALGQRRSQLMHTMRSTASEARYPEMAALQGQINALEHDQRKFALSNDEPAEYAAARQQIATLPARIQAVKQEGGPDAATRCATLTSQLVAAKATAARFAERIAEAESIGRKIAALEEQKEAIGQTFMDPEAMEFTSKPAPVR